MIKRILALALTLVLCCGLIACGGEETVAEKKTETKTETKTENAGGETTTAPEQLSADAEYTVKVVDALGNPYTETALVRFMQDGQQKSLQQAKDGVATKTLPRGEYNLVLDLVDSERDYVYDTEATVTSTETSVELVVTYKLGEETAELYTSETPVHFIGEGCTTVTVTGGERTYFLFNQERVGKFSFTTVGGGTVGYYGGTHMVQDHSAAEVVNNTFELNIKAGQVGGQPLVIGVDSETDGEVILCVTYVGEPDWGVEDEPVHTYQPTVELSAFTLPAGTKLADFDLTAEGYNLVKDEQGIYHLNAVEGPVVYTYLTVKSKYLDPLQIVAEKSGVGKVFWKDAENHTKESFEKRESYNACINAYCAVADADAGVYPLTDDLMYILQQHGEYYGWWNSESYSYLFKDANGGIDTTINPSVAWLFACCYAQ